MTTPTPVDQLGYAEALAELETILNRLEHDEPDVDRVADDVSRAAELVRQCRSRITDARVRVEEVVGDLVPESPAQTTSQTEPEPDTDEP